MKRCLGAAMAAVVLSIAVGILGWGTSRPTRNPAVALMLNSNRDVLSEQQVAKQRRGYLRTIRKQFSFRASESRVIYQMAGSTFRSQIVGGSSAPDGMLPWQVAILLKPYRWQFCGGSIISPTWVLTAAHCVDHAPYSIPQRIVIFAGSATLLAGGRGIAVVKVIPHPRWNPKTNDNDIALLQLSTPAKIAEVISTVGANEEATLTADTARGLVSGWGRTVESGQLSRTLMFVDVPFIARQLCNAPDSYNGAITTNMLCAGEEGKDSCDGDSGGPLIAPFSQPLSVPAIRLVGIVSFGEGCARAKKYGVYTRVRNYLDWIEATKQANP